MTSLAATLLSFAPLSGDASPVSLGLGHDHLIQTENSCGSFCLSSSNANFDVTLNAIISQAQLPQRKSSVDSDMSVSPINVTTFDVSWHPFYDAVVGAGYRTSSRSAERKTSGKIVRRLTATTREIPVSVAARPFEPLSIAGRIIMRDVVLSQENPTGTQGKFESYAVAPHRWSVDALWQKNDTTGFGVSYLAPTLKKMTSNLPSKSNSKTAGTPTWTDPQEFTLSVAHFSSMRPPEGVTFGPFENVFHASASAVTWESGKPVAYAALASSAAAKDGWNLVNTSGAAQEFEFDTLDPSLSASAGLESRWMRNTVGSVSTFTHVRLNHIAAKRDSTDWQGGFGVSFSSRFLSLQGSTVWRDQEAGYALGFSSSF